MTDSLVNNVSTVNSLITQINKGLASIVKGKNFPVNAEADIKEAQEIVKKSATKIKKAVEQPKEEKPVEKQVGNVSSTDYWGDPRYNPHFLRVAEFFGIDQKEYPFASSKINEIVRWAEKESGSKDIQEILKKVSSTSRKLPTPGYGERRYAILHRYIKLGLGTPK